MAKKKNPHKTKQNNGQKTEIGTSQKNKSKWSINL